MNFGSSRAPSRTNVSRGFSSLTWNIDYLALTRNHSISTSFMEWKLVNAGERVSGTLLGPEGSGDRPHGPHIRSEWMTSRRTARVSWKAPAQMCSRTNLENCIVDASIYK